MALYSMASRLASVSYTHLDVYKRQTQGLEKLGVSFADVKIDILDEGSKGFLGILGGKPVVVRLTVREDVEEGEDLLSSVALEDAVKEPEQKPCLLYTSRCV